MMRPGLVSVTFKNRPFEDVIRHARRADLEVIEWHGEKHVPHGDLETAHLVGQSTRDAGLAVAAYGSYYVTGISEDAGLPFTTVLQTAEALRAPMVRVWAGDINPDKASSSYRARIVDEAKRIANLADLRKIKVVFEFHKGTLTRTGESCAAFMKEVDHPNARTYWQPAPELSVEANLDQLRRVLPWLVGLHVFHWKPTDIDRHPLAQGEKEWEQYLALARRSQDTLNVLLEFVKGSTVEQFKEDAATLHRLLKQGVSHDNL